MWSVVPRIKQEELKERGRMLIQRGGPGLEIQTGRDAGGTRGLGRDVCVLHIYEWKVNITMRYIFRLMDCSPLDPLSMEFSRQGY